LVQDLAVGGEAFSLALFLDTVGNQAGRDPGYDGPDGGAKAPSFRRKAATYAGIHLGRPKARSFYLE